MKLSRANSLILKSILTIGLVAGLIWFLNFPQLLNQLQNVHLIWLIYACLAGIAMQFLLAYKVVWITGKDTIPFSKLIRIQFISTFTNNIFPGSLGGDLVRGFYFGKEIQSFEKSIWILLIDRGTGFSLQVILAVSSYFTLTVFGLDNNSFIGATGIILGLVISLAIGKPFLKFLLFLLGPSGPGFLQRFKFRGKSLQGLRELLFNFSHSQLQFNMVILFSFVTQLFLALIIVFILFSLDISIQLPHIFLINFLSTLTNFIPLTLGNLGLRESLFAGYFQMLKKSGEIGFGTALLFRVILIPPGLIGAYLYATHKNQPEPKERE